MSTPFCSQVIKSKSMILTTLLICNYSCESVWKNKNKVWGLGMGLAFVLFLTMSFVWSEQGLTMSTYFQSNKVT